MKKRVLQFVGSFNQGGSERQALTLTRSLKNEGTFDVFAATLNNTGVLRVEFDAIGLADIPEFSLSSFYDLNFVRQVRRCAAYLRDNKIDLIQTNDFYTNVFGMAAATLARIPVRIASKRETDGMRTRTQEMLERVAFSRARTIIANCNAVRDHLTLKGIANKKIAVIYNGLAPRGTSPSRWEGVRDLVPSVGENTRLITLIANLRHNVKNVPMLLRAAKRVIQHDKNAHFVVAGEGERRDELEGLAVRLGVAGNTHFIGRCDDVPSLIAASYAGVLTSAAEGLSNSIIEYMEGGKPVVATNVGGAAEAIIEGETGFLIPSDDDASLAHRLIELLDDRKKAAAFGNAGRRVARERFSQEAQVRKTVELYRSLLTTN